MIPQRGFRESLSYTPLKGGYCFFSIAHVFPPKNRIKCYDNLIGFFLRKMGKAVRIRDFGWGVVRKPVYLNRKSLVKWLNRKLSDDFKCSPKDNEHNLTKAIYRVCRIRAHKFYSANLDTMDLPGKESEIEDITGRRIGDYDFPRRSRN